MITAIIFDCFGVLYRSSAHELYDRCLPERRNDLHDLRLSRDRGALHYDEYLQAVAKLLEASTAEVRYITESLHIRNRELFDYIAGIDRGHYRTAMLSNIGDTTMEQLFRPDELEALFDAVVLSYREHMTKPDPRIFALTAERIGVLPEQCIMIDDAPVNCQGAIAVGMQAIEFTTTGACIDELSKRLHTQDY